MRRLTVITALVSLLAITTSAVAVTSVVSPTNLHGWQDASRAAVGFCTDKGWFDLVHGPANPPLGKGSLRLLNPDNGCGIAGARVDLDTPYPTVGKLRGLTVYNSSPNLKGIIVTLLVDGGGNSFQYFPAVAQNWTKHDGFDDNDGFWALNGTEVDRDDTIAAHANGTVTSVVVSIDGVGNNDEEFVDGLNISFGRDPHSVVYDFEPGTASLHYVKADHAFEGDLVVLARCLAGRTVHLFKAAKGDDPEYLPSVQTDANGHYAFAGDKHRGKYYAVIAPVSSPPCEGFRSKPLKIG